MSRKAIAEEIDRKVIFDLFIKAAEKILSEKYRKLGK